VRCRAPPEPLPLKSGALPCPAPPRPTRLPLRPPAGLLAAAGSKAAASNLRCSLLAWRSCSSWRSNDSMRSRISDMSAALSDRSRSLVWSSSGRGWSSEWSAPRSTKTGPESRSCSRVPRFMRLRTASTVMPRTSEASATGRRLRPVVDWSSPTPPCIWTVRTPAQGPRSHPRGSDAVLRAGYREVRRRVASGRYGRTLVRACRPPARRRRSLDLASKFGRLRRSVSLIAMISPAVRQPPG
jgi:hypothetical protein